MTLHFALHTCDGTIGNLFISCAVERDANCEASGVRSNNLDAGYRFASWPLSNGVSMQAFRTHTPEFLTLACRSLDQPEVGKRPGSLPGAFMPHAFRNASLRSKTDVPIAKLRAFLNSIQSATAYETAWRATLRGAAIHYYNQTERLLSVCHITNSAARRVLGIDPTFRLSTVANSYCCAEKGTCLAMMRGYGARVFANNSARSCCDVGSWHNSVMPPWSLHVRCWGQTEDIGSERVFRLLTQAV